MNDLHLIGLDFRTATFPLRSRVAIHRDSAARVLGWIGAREALAISTCNRTELVFLGGSVEAAVEALAEHAGIATEVLELSLYELHGRAAIRHLLRLASGMESAVLGETEIVAQLKHAIQVGHETGHAGPELVRLIGDALRTSKRVRTETSLCRGVVSLGSLAWREAKSAHGDLREKSVVVFGAGQMAQRLLKETERERPRRLILVNRSRESATVLAKTHRAELWPLDRALEALEVADIGFCAISGRLEFVGDCEVAEVVAGRDRPLTLVDLGVPANLPETFTSLNGVTVLGMDHLVELTERNARLRGEASAHAEAIIEEELYDCRLMRRAEVVR
jgi:glutamyl-tRNA reductase